MPIDVTPVFQHYFARNRSPVPGNPTVRQTANYRVAASLHDDTIELSFAFLSGSTYCCFEWGCHCWLHAGKRWDWLRREFALRSIPVSPQLRLEASVVVEAGALFFDFSNPEPSPRGRGWYAFAPSDRIDYRTIVSEARASNDPP